MRVFGFCGDISAWRGCSETAAARTFEATIIIFAALKK
jgi:hypothetical protein